MLDQRWRLLEIYPSFSHLEHLIDYTYPIDGENLLATCMIASGGIDVFLAKATAYTAIDDQYHIYRFLIWHNLGHVDFYEHMESLLGGCPVDSSERGPVPAPRFMYRGNYPYRIDIPKLMSDCRKCGHKYPKLRDLYSVVYSGTMSYLEKVSMMMCEKNSVIDSYTFLKICSLHNLDPSEYMWCDLRNGPRIRAYNKLRVVSDIRNAKVEASAENEAVKHARLRTTVRI